MLADREPAGRSPTLIKKAVDLDPRYNYLDSLGWAYFKLGKYDRRKKTCAAQPIRARMMRRSRTIWANSIPHNRFKLAAAHWEHALYEWNKSTPGDVDQQDVARVTKKLESTKVKLAQQTQKE